VQAIQCRVMPIPLVDVDMVAGVEVAALAEVEVLAEVLVGQEPVMVTRLGAGP